MRTESVKWQRAPRSGTPGTLSVTNAVSGTYALAGNAANFNSAMSLTVGENTYANALTVGNRIRSCHIKDATLERELQSFCIYEVPLGEGLMNLRHYLDRIEALDPDMPVLFEHWKTMEEFDRCLAWCKREIPELMVR